MTDSKRPTFGLRRDGSIDRRDFLRTAGRLGVGAFGVSSLGLASGIAQAQQPFNIGWVRPTTGRLASSFSYLYIGGLIAIEEINAAGGIMGRPIARIEEDDETSPAKEPAIVKKLQESGINFIAGPTGSSRRCRRSPPRRRPRSSRRPTPTARRWATARSTRSTTSAPSTPTSRARSPRATWWRR
jgi:hypothetical protein